MTNQTPSLEEALAHYGVPGMKWGKHKARPTSSPSGGSSSTKKTAPKDKAKIKGTPEHAARQAQRLAIGKRVGVNVLAAVGGVAVASVAGSVAGTATSALLREFGTTRIITDHPSAFSPDFVPPGH